jgi:hypothetical protein
MELFQDNFIPDSLKVFQMLFSFSFFAGNRPDCKPIRFPNKKMKKKFKFFDRFVRRKPADMIPESLPLSSPFISKFFVRL